MPGGTESKAVAVRGPCRQAVLNVLGDRAQLGCNSVANPGTFVGKNSLIYTGSTVMGFIPENTIVKLRQTFEQAELRVAKT